MATAFPRISISSVGSLMIRSMRATARGLSCPSIATIAITALARRRESSDSSSRFSAGSRRTRLRTVSRKAFDHIGNDRDVFVGQQPDKDGHRPLVRLRAQAREKLQHCPAIGHNIGFRDQCEQRLDGRGIVGPVDFPESPHSGESNSPVGITRGRCHRRGAIGISPERGERLGGGGRIALDRSLSNWRKAWVLSAHSFTAKTGSVPRASRWCQSITGDSRQPPSSHFAHFVFLIMRRRNEHRDYDFRVRPRLDQ